MIIPGNLRIKVLCSAHISARGILTAIGTRIRMSALSVLELLGCTIDKSNYPRPPEKAGLRDMEIDALRGEPAHEDPGIGKVERLE
jgi:hypothetical protein